MIMYQYSNSAIDTKGDKAMSEELRNAVEMGQYELLDYEDLTLDEEMIITYQDYKWSDEY